MSDSARENVLFQILMNTLQELWVLKDRQMILERVLKEQGIDVADAINRWQPDDEQKALLDSERKRFLETVLEPAHRSNV